MENIPDQLFDLLEQKEFHELNAEEQAGVLACMDKQTYTSMRNASVLSHNFFEGEKPIDVNPAQLQQLLKKVETKHLTEQPAIVWNKPVALWKVAALFLLLGGGSLIFILANQNQVIRTSYITQLDTVFVEKEVPAEKIHDTVYIGYERKQQKQHTHRAERLPTEHYLTPAQDANIPTMSDVNIVRIKEKDEPINNKKGNSIKDDSLINAFGFVTL
ncbi:MAG: hypothetical protein V4651_02135 [Bacteroidota bacterium]